jgi:hypothetical protein
VDKQHILATNFHHAIASQPTSHRNLMPQADRAAIPVEFRESPFGLAIVPTQQALF